MNNQVSPLSTTSRILTKTSSTQFGKVHQCGIDNKYLQPLRYRCTCEFASKRNILYASYCAAIEEYYKFYDSIYQKFTQKVKLNTDHDKHPFKKEFKTFLKEFFTIIHESSVIHIDYFEQIKESREENLAFSTEEIIEKAEVYQRFQDKFVVLSEKHQTKLKEMEYLNNSLKKDRKDPLHFFNYKTTVKKSKTLLEYLQAEETIRSQMNEKLNKISENSRHFEESLILYRQQFVSNKYRMLKKFIEMARNSKNSIIELLVYLYDCISHRNQEFSAFVKNADSAVRKRSKSMSHLEDKLAVESFLTEITNEYNRMMVELQEIVQQLIQIFEHLTKLNTLQSETHLQILANLNGVYEVEESPIKDVSESLELYQYFTKKIGYLSNGLNSSHNELVKLRSEVKKVSEITMSLIRNSWTSSERNIGDSDGGQGFQIQILLQKVSSDYPINIVQKIYKNFQETLNYLKNHVSSKFDHRKRKVQDSMQISHIEETIIKPLKRPCKNEKWLWEKWQNEEVFRPMSSSKVQELQTIKSQASKLAEPLQDSPQMDRFSATIDSTKEPTGFISLSEKYLKFDSSGSHNLIIPLEMIEDIRVVVKVFSKILEIDTPFGHIGFKNIIDIQTVIDSIEDVRTRTGNPISKPPREVVQVTAEELAAMNQRKEKIKPELPDLSKLQKVEELTIQNFTIDHVYELIYSDKEQMIKGKPYTSFLGYDFQKSKGAANYEITNFDTKGPRFYTHEQGVSFLNCPTSSSRVAQYELKLPPIPFMPKFAKCKQILQLFWISHEEFIYKMHSTTVGPPKSDTFHIQVCHHVQKQGEGSTVKIEFYWAIFFSEDSYLKGTIKSNATTETLSGIQGTTRAIKKYLQMQGSSGGTVQENNEKEAKEESVILEIPTGDGKGVFSKLTKTHMYIIGVLGLALFINICFKMFS